MAAQNVNRQLQEITWDECYFGIAILAAGRSEHPTNWVGCCIVAPKEPANIMAKRVIAIGCNGKPKKTEENDSAMDIQCCAEMNALIHRTVLDITGYKLYCTHEPCVHCKSYLLQSGVREFHYMFELKLTKTKTELISALLQDTDFVSTVASALKVNNKLTAKVTDIVLLVKEVIVKDALKTDKHTLLSLTDKINRAEIQLSSSPVSSARVKVSEYYAQKRLEEPEFEDYIAKMVMLLPIMIPCHREDLPNVAMLCGKEWKTGSTHNTESWNLNHPSNKEFERFRQPDKEEKMQEIKQSYADKYFMGIAITMALRSRLDPKYGACIVKDRQVVALGFNGYPRDQEGKQIMTTEVRGLLPAETNALLFRNVVDVSGCTVYTVGYPDMFAMRALAQAGIKRLVSLENEDIKAETRRKKLKINDFEQLKIENGSNLIALKKRLQNAENQ